MPPEGLQPTGVPPPTPHQEGSGQIPKESSLQSQPALYRKNSSTKRVQMDVDETNGNVNYDGNDKRISMGSNNIGPLEDESSFLSESFSHAYSSQDDQSRTTAQASVSQLKRTHQHIRRETKRVLRMKFFVIFVMIAAAIGVSIATYSYASKAEVLDFETRFQDFANEIITGSLLNAGKINDAMKSMSITATNMAIQSDEEWPFVTFPNFEPMGSQLREQTGASFVTMAPLVREDQRNQWESYSLDNQGWVQDGIDYILGAPDTMTALPIFPQISTLVFDESGNVVRGPLGHPRPTHDPYYAPSWQASPANDPSLQVNYNAFGYKGYSTYYETMVETRDSVLSKVINYGASNAVDVMDLWPASYVVTPVFNTFDSNSFIVSIINAVVPWHKFFANVLPEDVEGLDLVVRNQCDQVLTFEVKGPEVRYLGTGDLHSSKYDELEVLLPFDVVPNLDDCPYTLHVYPTENFVIAHTSNRPIIITIGVVFVFVLTGFVFLVYDCLVEQRQHKIVTSADRTNAIVDSLFPANVRERILDNDGGRKIQGLISGDGPGNDMMQMRNDGFVFSIEQDDQGIFATKPIADLFPNATVMFADIVGFTAWSSVREPSQVFTLLETLYNSFDRIAKRRKVFKVETIGDCYVAATGLPEARKDHAVVMARFARDCLVRMNEVVNHLETTLGPDTGELSMRFGLHSGPVTAGVLRGEKSRFQLFGDTVNTAARIESSGLKDRVHISQETADLLIEGGRSDWIKKRDTKITAKGKGEMQTYWLSMPGCATSGSDSVSNITEMQSEMLAKEGVDSRNDLIAEADTTEEVLALLDDKTRRLIGWNVDVLMRLLRQILAMRNTPPPSSTDQQQQQQHTTGLSRKSKFFGSAGDLPSILTKGKWGSMGESVTEAEDSDDISLKIDRREGATVLDEVKEIIQLPSEPAKYRVDPTTIEFDENVKTQLTDYVAAIATMYRDNPFHSFEHASHVTMSVTKLLSRVVTEDTIDYQEMTYKRKGVDTLHEYTYGITSDPITQFACAFSALIHDVDHTGVPNAILIKENAAIAKLYRNQSVAEQNSVDIAWELLMEDKYKDLRNCIFKNQEELDRFRQLVVNSVMATDIVDKELGALRRKRWEKAFKNDNVISETAPLESDQEQINRKATIVIEHIIQASDVAHTMQHWHVYQKWNERLFREMYKAYKEGRSDADPSAGWYQGELGFYDFYIIPLAKKLKECGVFGVSSDEYLNYAQANRGEWETKGKDIVEMYLKNYEEAQQKKQALQQ